MKKTSVEYNVEFYMSGKATAKDVEEEVRRRVDEFFGDIPCDVYIEVEAKTTLGGQIAGLSVEVQAMERESY